MKKRQLKKIVVVIGCIMLVLNGCGNSEINEQHQEMTDEYQIPVENEPQEILATESQSTENIGFEPYEIELSADDKYLLGSLCSVLMGCEFVNKENFSVATMGDEEKSQFLFSLFYQAAVDKGLREKLPFKKMNQVTKEELVSLLITSLGSEFRNETAWKKFNEELMWGNGEYGEYYDEQSNIYKIESYIALLGGDFINFNKIDKVVQETETQIRICGRYGDNEHYNFNDEGLLADYQKSYTAIFKINEKSMWAGFELIDIQLEEYHYDNYEEAYKTALSNYYNDNIVAQIIDITNDGVPELLIAKQTAQDRYLVFQFDNGSIKKMNIEFSSIGYDVWGYNVEAPYELIYYPAGTGIMREIYMVVDDRLEQKLALDGEETIPYYGVRENSGEAFQVDADTFESAVCEIDNRFVPFQLTDIQEIYPDIAEYKANMMQKRNGE